MVGEPSLCRSGYHTLSRALTWRGSVFVTCDDARIWLSRCCVDRNFLYVHIYIYISVIYIYIFFSWFVMLFIFLFFVYLFIFSNHFWLIDFWTRPDFSLGLAWNVVPIHYFHSRDWSMGKKRKRRTSLFTEIGGHRFRIYSSWSLL